MRTTHQGNISLVEDGPNVYMFEITDDQRTPYSDTQPYPTAEEKTFYPLRVGNFEIIPHGQENRLPYDIRKLLDEENLSPEFLNKQTQLLFGQGPALYETRFENGEMKRYWDTVPEIESFLNDWDYEDYLLRATIEFRHMNGHYSKYFRSRGARIGGETFVTHLENVPATHARLEWPDQQNNINHIIVGDWGLPWQSGMRKYPVFRREDPFAKRVSMRYSNLYSFALANNYSRSPFHGNFSWIKLHSQIAPLLISFNVNAAVIKYHIKSPALYWHQKEEKLKEKCEAKNITYKPEMLEELKDNIYKKMAEGLTNTKNAGKFITTETIWDEDSREYVEFKIEPLDQKVKDFIDAQVNTAKRANLEITSGFGLHPALSNVSTDGNLPSGSEQLYAFKLYLQTGIYIPERIICKDINHAIAVNFPKSKFRLGFYHNNVLTEEETTPENRMKNN